jgi:hypothetical protein
MDEIDRRILDLALRFGLIHSSDNDVLGEMANELLGLIEENYSHLPLFKGKIRWKKDK